ncbi:NfeD family protein [Geodermatophilaceae bacterium NBWT11]|nr:NfeD family protein [Geodermatophilaceae bacterium NBWT11]
MSWLLWLIAAGLLTAGEMASLDLVLIMLAGGALGGMGVALATDNVALQVAGFVVVSLALLVVVRPVAKRHLTSRTAEQVDGVEVYVGRTAEVSERVDGESGQVKMGHDEWSARTQLDGESYEVGAVVRIVQIEGPIAYVSRA